MNLGAVTRSNNLQTRLRSVPLFRSFELSTAQGRSRERYRRAFLTAVSSGVSKLTMIATSIISIPLTLHYLGVERYGLWMTISSLIAFLGFADLGLSNGLLNGIARSHGNEDRVLARQYVSSAFFCLIAISVLLGLVFAAAYPWISWNSLFHVKSSRAISEAGPAVAMFLVLFLVGIPAGIVTRIQSGYQEGFAANLWALCGSLAGLAAVLVVIRLRGSLMFLVLALSGAPILTLLMNSAVLFGYQRPWLRPAWSQVRPDVSGDLLRSGFLFFALQLAMAVGFSSDNIVLAQVMGPEAVTQYSIPSKLFGLIGVLGSFLINPLWPAYTEALVRRDHDWVRKALRRSMSLYILLASGLSILFVFVGPTIMRLWVGPTVHPSFRLLLALAAWSVVTALSMPVAILLNAAMVVNFQVIVASFAALTNVGLSIYLTRRIGIPGVVFGSIISQVFLVLLPYWLYSRRFLRSLATSILAEPTASR